MYYSRYGRRSAYSSGFTLLALAIVIPLEMCTDHGYSTHTQRSSARKGAYQQQQDRRAARIAAENAPKATPHAAGAFYPDEHPELLAEHGSTPTSIVPYISAGIGGMAVFGMVGAGAFMVLGMVSKEPEHIDLDVDPSA